VESVVEEASVQKDADDWHHPTKATAFDYTFDKPGTYTFAVQAIDRDLNYSEPASITLKVVPPWYLNGWIVIPSGMTILAILVASIFFGWRSYAHRRESQRLKLEMAMADAGEREREKIGQDLHDDLGQHLTGVAFLSKALQANLAETRLADTAEQAGEIRRLTNQSIRHVIWPEGSFLWTWKKMTSCPHCRHWRPMQKTDWASYALSTTIPPFRFMIIPQQHTFIVLGIFQKGQIWGWR
jgi:hypothetical protein